MRTLVIIDLAEAAALGLGENHTEDDSRMTKGYGGQGTGVFHDTASGTLPRNRYHVALRPQDTSKDVGVSSALRHAGLGMATDSHVAEAAHTSEDMLIFRRRTATSSL